MFADDVLCSKSKEAYELVWTNGYIKEKGNERQRKQISIYGCKEQIESQLIYRENELDSRRITWFTKIGALDQCNRGCNLEVKRRSQAEWHG